jgi:hypothetical protein
VEKGFHHGEHIENILGFVKQTRENSWFRWRQLLIGYAALPVPKLVKGADAFRARQPSLAPFPVPRFIRR